MDICFYEKYVSSKQLKVVSTEGSVKVEVIGRGKTSIDGVNYKEGTSVDLTGDRTVVIFGSEKKGKCEMTIERLDFRCYYSLDNEDLGEIEPCLKGLEKYGMTFHKDISDVKGYTHYIKGKKLSNKLALALVNGLTILSSDCLRRMYKDTEEAVEHYSEYDLRIPGRKLPRTAQLEYSGEVGCKDVEYGVSAERQRLFERFTFAVGDESQCSYLKAIVESGGGQICYVVDVDSAYDALHNAADTQVAVFKSPTVSETKTERMNFKKMKQLGERLGLGLVTNKEFFESILKVDTSGLIKPLGVTKRRRMNRQVERIDPMSLFGNSKEPERPERNESDEVLQVSQRDSRRRKRPVLLKNILVDSLEAEKVEPVDIDKTEGVGKTPETSQAVIEAVAQEVPVASETPPAISLPVELLVSAAEEVAQPTFIEEVQKVKQQASQVPDAIRHEISKAEMAEIRNKTQIEVVEFKKSAGKPNTFDNGVWKNRKNFKTFVKSTPGSSLARRNNSSMIKAYVTYETFDPSAPEAYEEADPIGKVRKPEKKHTPEPVASQLFVELESELQQDSRSELEQDSDEDAAVPKFQFSKRRT